jgi:exosortase
MARAGRSLAPWLPTLAAALALGLLFSPTLDWLADTWRVHPYYTHGPLVVLAAAALAWRARGVLSDGTPRGSGLLLIAAGVGLHLAAMPSGARLPSMAGLLLVLAGAALTAGGLSALRALSLPLLLLAMAVPLPWVERMAPFLAARVAAGAALLASGLGADIQQVGAQLVVGDGVLAVGAPCSGLRSLVAMATLAVLLAGLLDGPRKRRALLVLAAIPLALAANGLRLTALLWVAHLRGAETGLALFHGPILAPLIYAIAAVLLVAVSRGLGFDVRPATS